MRLFVCLFVVNSFRQTSGIFVMYRDVIGVKATTQKSRDAAKRMYNSV